MTLLLLAVGLYASAALAAAIFHQRLLGSVYPLCMAASFLAILAGLSALFGGTTEAWRLPLGLPSIGLHLSLDPLAGFFGFIVNGGVLAASIYGMGLDREHDLSPRIEPLFPAFAAAMNLVLIADDAFVFLFSWELMSLTSWALVVRAIATRTTARAGHLYLVMAAIGTAALLFAFGGMAGPAGGYALRHHPQRHRSRRLVAAPGADGGARRCRLEGRAVPAACLAAAGASGRAQPCLRADERRHDQGRDLWRDPHRLRSARRRRSGGGAALPSARRADRRAGPALRRAATAISRRAGLLDGREYRRHLRRRWAWRWPSAPTGVQAAGGARAWRPRCCTSLNH